MARGPPYRWGRECFIFKKFISTHNCLTLRRLYDVISEKLKATRIIDNVIKGYQFKQEVLLIQEQNYSTYRRENAIEDTLGIKTGSKTVEQIGKHLRCHFNFKNIYRLKTGF